MRAEHEKRKDGCVGLAGYDEELHFGLIEGGKVVGSPLEDEIEITIDGDNSREAISNKGIGGGELGSITVGGVEGGVCIKGMDESCS